MKVIIIGGGAAGMMAGVVLADKGYEPVIIEKNEKLGKKLFITGKGRCNITNNCEYEDLMNNIVTNSRFMYSAFSKCLPSDVIEFFQNEGLHLKTERGNRVFPESDHSSDVIKTLEGALYKRHVSIRLNTEVTDILTIDDDGEKSVIGVKTKFGQKTEEIKARYVVVATGGVSYSSTGSTGDGIKWAERLGLKIEVPKPALVPLNISEEYCKDIMGLSLRNISVRFIARVKNKEKVIYEDFGELLFTHFGVSGPVILSASSFLHKYYNQGVKLFIDLKPALDNEVLNQRVLKDFEKNSNKQLVNSLGGLLPSGIIPFVIKQSLISPEKKCNEISKEDRERLVNVLKGFTLHIIGPRSFNEAIITSGGVSVKEINPANMESKLIKGLHFIGEVIDVDALTGGYNLQVAWSTANALE